MGKAEERAKMSKMASDLIARGYPHGKRMSKPFPNSGGLTMVFAPGSTKYQRLMASKIINKR